MSKHSILLAALLLPALTGVAAEIKAETEKPEAEPHSPRAEAQQVLNFAMLDQTGKYYELKRSDAKVIVLFFTANGCPIARQSVSKLRSLRSKFAKQGVQVWMINSSPQDDRQGIEEEANEFKVGSIPILKDETQGVARSLGVKRTCDTIAINCIDRSIVYRGAIDDQLTEGAKKSAPTEKFLENALAEFLAGKPVTKATAPVSGCLISFGGENAAISYNKEVAPLLQKKCVSCHSPGNIGPFAMSSHRKIKGWADMIQEVILAKRMPPWHADPHFGTFANDRSLTTDEAKLLLRWIELGCPQDAGEDPLVKASGPDPDWALGKPDFVVQLPKQQQIAATGLLPYRFLDAEFEVPEDSWVRAAVCRPDNKKVVHHIIVRIRYPDGAKRNTMEEVLFTSWAPGAMAQECPAGTGKFIPKGAKFVFEMHYTTTGKAEIDQSDMGIYLAKEKPKLVLETRAAENRDLTINPGDADARSHALYCFKRDTLVYDLAPHMHLRGSWFQYELLLPSGQREVLLRVPNYDFQWQSDYRFAEPKRVPAGSWLFCTGGFDNSSRNPNNPDPAKRIRWGIQSFDEMFMGFMNVAEIPAAEKSAKGDGTTGQ